MKLNYIKVKNFKKIKEVEIDLSNKEYLLIIGDNGSGKTSLLQAIALSVGSACAHVKNLNTFSKNWQGFLPDKDRIGKFEIKVEVELDSEELKLIEELASKYVKITNSQKKLVPKSKVGFKITYEDFKKVKDTYMLLPKFEEGEKFNLWGRYYIRNLDLPFDEKIKLYRKIGDIFWFDQRRTIFQPQEEGEEKNYSNAWEKGIESLRKYLINWYYHHLSLKKNNEEADLYKLLEERFQKVFNVKFLGTLWKKPNATDYLDITDFYFVLEKDGDKYDIAEVSSGEEMLFIIVFESVRLHIYNSIVLIDEIELHLNPAEQERLFKNLPYIFPDCQFIITTHSPYMLKFFEKDEIIRLENGSLVCMK